MPVAICAASRGTRPPATRGRSPHRRRSEAIALRQRAESHELGARFHTLLRAGRTERTRGHVELRRAEVLALVEIEDVSEIVRSLGANSERVEAPAPLDHSQ